MFIFKQIKSCSYERFCVEKELQVKKKTWKWLIKFSCNSIDFDSSVTIFENEKGTFTSVS